MKEMKKKQTSKTVHLQYIINQSIIHIPLFPLYAHIKKMVMHNNHMLSFKAYYF